MQADGTRVQRLTAHPAFDGVPVPSPEGSRIAFMRGVPAPGNALHWQLHVMDADGANERPVTTGAWSSQVPTWTPDALALAFHANATGRDQLYRLDLATGHVALLHESSADDHAPSFSPDGPTLAFTSNRDSGTDHDVYTLDLIGGDVRRITTNLKAQSQPGWSADGRRLVISGAPEGTSDVYIVNVDGTELRRVTRGREGARTP